VSLRTRTKKVVAVMVVVWLPLSHELRFSDGPGFDAARRGLVLPIMPTRLVVAMSSTMGLRMREYWMRTIREAFEQDKRNYWAEPTFPSLVASGRPRFLGVRDDDQ